MSPAGASGAPRAPRVVAGIDEAGLGPLLGPLTLGYAGMRLPGRKLNVWDELSEITLPLDSIMATRRRPFTRFPSAFCRCPASASQLPRSDQANRPFTARIRLLRSSTA